MKFLRLPSRTVGSNTLVNISPRRLLYASISTKSSTDSCCKSSLLQSLHTRIKFSGPITVSEYMKEALTNPVYGYYMNSDVFGLKGDFITSPEISQMFGEILGIWIYNEWYKIGLPKPLLLVEMGPGRGTLLKDILRVLHKFSVSPADLKLHLVEASPFMKNIQQKNLCSFSTSKNLQDDDMPVFHSSEGFEVTWHTHFSDVPYGFSFILAHEFFDALPIHKLHNTDHGWREVLIDSVEVNGSPELRFVISRNPTPVSSLVDLSDEKRRDVEVSIASATLVKEIATRLEENGGSLLVIDYGHEGTAEDTFRAFKNHKLHDPLRDPGMADLTADVDFAFLKKQVRDKLVPYGPVRQNFFLKNMGIELRLMNLLKDCSVENRGSLISGYKMLVDPKQIGDKYKVSAFFPLVLKDFLIKFPPAGFFRSLDGVS